MAAPCDLRGGLEQEPVRSLGQRAAKFDEDFRGVGLAREDMGFIDHRPGRF